MAVRCSRRRPRSVRVFRPYCGRPAAKPRGPDRNFDRLWHWLIVAGDRSHAVPPDGPAAASRHRLTSRVNHRLSWNAPPFTRSWTLPCHTLPARGRRAPGGQDGGACGEERRARRHRCCGGSAAAGAARAGDRSRASCAHDPRRARPRARGAAAVRDQAESCSARMADASAARGWPRSPTRSAARRAASAPGRWRTRPRPSKRMRPRGRDIAAARWSGWPRPSRARAPQSDIADADRATKLDVGDLRRLVHTGAGRRERL